MRTLIFLIIVSCLFLSAANLAAAAPLSLTIDDLFPVPVDGDTGAITPGVYGTHMLRVSNLLLLNPAELLKVDTPERDSLTLTNIVFHNDSTVMHAYDIKFSDLFDAPPNGLVLAGVTLDALINKVTRGTADDVVFTGTVNGQMVGQVFKEIPSLFMGVFPVTGEDSSQINVFGARTLTGEVVVSLGPGDDFVLPNSATVSVAAEPPYVLLLGVALVGCIACARLRPAA